MIADVPQRQSKVQEIYLKCSKARNEYLLNLAAANASMKKYYLQDISALIDVSAFAFSFCYRVGPEAGGIFFFFFFQFNRQLKHN